jgi:lipopolysaccharide/colanic/teichoic acid biosynthesis glycosyltransferase
MNSRSIKIIFDVSAAAILLILLSPIAIGISIWIYLTMGQPVFFRQQRSGLRGAPFLMYKFRTMRPLNPGEQPGTDDLTRITRVGNFLRKSSLDEIPQLLNVLKGNISLVGPRPLLMQYVARYSPEQKRRLHVKPGITGWAQVNGRNAISWEEKFRLDVWYVDHWSILLDLKILYLTFAKVLRSQGIQADAQVTMTEFMGSSSSAETDGLLK